MKDELEKAAEAYAIFNILERHVVDGKSKIDFIAGAQWQQQQPDPVKEQLAEALKNTHAALTDLIIQLPNDESLAGFRLDFAESASFKAIDALSSYEAERQSLNNEKE